MFPANPPPAHPDPSPHPPPLYNPKAQVPSYVNNDPLDSSRAPQTVTGSIGPDRNTEMKSRSGKLKLVVPQGAVDKEADVDII